MARLSRRGALVVGLGLALLGSGTALAAGAPGDISLGSAKAPVEVVEYLSLTCPHCAEFNEEVFPTLKAKYVDTGQVRWTFRELLTPPAQVAAAGFLMARCLGPSKYPVVIDQVLRSQPRWRSGSLKPIFLEIAKAHGMNEAQFDACIADPKNQEALQARITYATQQDKVQSTPAFFVNGKPLPADRVPSLADMEAAIAEAAKARRR